MKKQWHIHTPDRALVGQLCTALKCHPVTAAVLVNRNLASATEAYAFLHTSMKDLRAPFAVKDMAIAVRRIHTALVEKEKILIFGDYDVDGVTATALLFEFLRTAGASVAYYVPHRSEGYGLQKRHIHEHILPNGYGLLITVDCGISSHDAATAAKKAGVDLIITDHHQVSEPLPDAIAIVNPKRSDCMAGFEPLAGVGVAYLVLISLRKYLRDIGFWKTGDEPNLKDACDLVALGTVADIVPLTRENRIFTQMGLGVINAGLRPGIQALRTAADVRNPVTTEQDIAFRLAPRINAAGRMGHADTAVKLLTSRDPEQAAQLAAVLNEMNEKRRSTEQLILEQIREQLMIDSNLHRKPAIVLSNAQWHAGVLGIVAARLADQYCRPVVLISTQNGIGKGSARSIPGLNLYEGLNITKESLMGFGGHAGAAGLTIKSENIPLFTALFEDAVKRLTDPALFTPVLTIDQDISFDQISPRLANELEQLKPFGEGNPEPLFMARNIKVTFSKIIGKFHRRMALTQRSAKTTQPLQAIQFNVTPSADPPKYLSKIAFQLHWNRWNGKKTLQLVIEAAEEGS